MTTDLSRLDVPLPAVEAEAERLWQERDRRVGALAFRQAAERTHSPSDRIAFSHDAWLITHPEACATEADYPEWAAQFAAAQEADNRRAREATA